MFFLKMAHYSEGWNMKTCANFSSDVVELFFVVAFGCKVKMKQLSSVIQRSHLRFIKKSSCPRMTVNMQEPFRQMGAEHLLCSGPFICIVPDQAAYDRFCMRRHLVDVSVEYKQ